MINSDRTHQFFNLDDVIGEFPPDPESHAKHRAEILVKSDSLRVVLVTAIVGGKLNEHSAPGSITVQILKGQFVFTIEDEPRVMNAEDIVIVDPKIRHAVECTEDGAFLLTLVNPPARVS